MTSLLYRWTSRFETYLPFRTQPTPLPKPCPPVTSRPTLTTPNLNINLRTDCSSLSPRPQSPISIQYRLAASCRTDESWRYSFTHLQTQPDHTDHGLGRKSGGTTDTRAWTWYTSSSVFPFPLVAWAVGAPIYTYLPRSRLGFCFLQISFSQTCLRITTASSL
jgi:hypothetical protein